METAIKTSLPTKLVSLRKQKGLTQMELAEKLNVSRQAISRWEVGAAVPSTDNLKFLGDLYDVPVDYLLNDEIDDLNVLIECHDSKKCEDGKKSSRGIHRMVLRCTIFLIVMLIVIVWSVMYNNQKQEQLVPIDDMETVEEVDRPKVTFLLE